MQVELTPEEYRLLTDLLDRSMRDLKEEINKTEALDYKQALKERKQTLLGLIDKVGGAAVV